MSTSHFSYGKTHRTTRHLQVPKVTTIEVQESVDVSRPPLLYSLSIRGEQQRSVQVRMKVSWWNKGTFALENFLMSLDENALLPKKARIISRQKRFERRKRRISIDYKLICTMLCFVWVLAKAKQNFSSCNDILTCQNENCLFWQK